MNLHDMIENDSEKYKTEEDKAQAHRILLWNRDVDITKIDIGAVRLNERWDLVIGFRNTEYNKTIIGEIMIPGNRRDGKPIFKINTPEPIIYKTDSVKSLPITDMETESLLKANISVIRPESSQTVDPFDISDLSDGSSDEDEKIYDNLNINETLNMPKIRYSLINTPNDYEKLTQAIGVNKKLNDNQIDLLVKKGKKN
jgi:hypothetical protein